MLFHEQLDCNIKIKIFLHIEPKGKIRNEFLNAITYEMHNTISKDDNFTNFFTRANFILLKEKRIKCNKGIRK